MRFISNKEFKALQDVKDEVLFNEILSRVFNAAVETTITKLPEIVSRMVKSTAATQAMTKDFFTRNKIFDAHKEIVMAVVQDVESQHPDWDYTHILQHAEPIIKKKIEVEMPNLQTGIPDRINLDGNGVI